MATILPGAPGDMRRIAAVLLEIAGYDRREEIRNGTGPLRFEVPDDVAVEYERRIRASIEEPEPQPGSETVTGETPPEESVEGPATRPATLQTRPSRRNARQPR